jgi:hypothetical protein
MYKSWMWKQRSYREQFEDGGSAGGAAVVEDQEQNDDQQQDQDDESGVDDQGSNQDDPPAYAAEEVVISFGDEPVPEGEETTLELTPVQNAAWARMRKAERELKQRVRELEQAAAAQQAAVAPKEDVLGEKPTLEGCDFDAETYAEKLLAWTESKRKADEKAAAAVKEQEAAQAAWQGKVAAYRTAGASLKAAGFEDAEAVVMSTLSQTQQGILLEGPKTAEASAQLVAALGRNPAKLAELAAIKNPVKYAFAVAELVSQLKVTSRKQPPAPETQVRSSTGKVTAIDSTEARLEAEADKSGDRSKLIKYRLEKKRKTAA